MPRASVVSASAFPLICAKTLPFASLLLTNPICARQLESRSGHTKIPRCSFARLEPRHKSFRQKHKVTQVIFGTLKLQARKCPNPQEATRPAMPHEKAGPSQSARQALGALADGIVLG